MKNETKVVGHLINQTESIDLVPKPGDIIEWDSNTGTLVYKGNNTTAA